MCVLLIVGFFGVCLMVGRRTRERNEAREEAVAAWRELDATRRQLAELCAAASVVDPQPYCPVCAATTDEEARVARLEALFRNAKRERGIGPDEC